MRPRSILTFTVALVLGVALAKASSPEQNGVVRSGWRVSSTHTLPGVYSAPVLAIASEKLELKSRELLKEPVLECFFVPRIYGYDVVLLSARRLGSEEEKRIQALVDPCLEQATIDAKIYSQEKQANQAPEPTAPSGRGSA